MTPQILSRAIEPFYTTKPAGQGTGLGLSQVYGFVRQSGGFLRIDSEPGRGTSVIISLPGSPRSQDAAKDRSKPVGPSTAPSSARGAVLVVDDQAEIRAQIVEVLTEMGCEVIEAADGPEGLRLIGQRRALDLLVTDVGLPGLSGRQLADAARAATPACRFCSSPATRGLRSMLRNSKTAWRSCESRLPSKNLPPGSRLFCRDRRILEARPRVE
jgi:CheY-like chemotaxis protein